MRATLPGRNNDLNDNDKTDVAAAIIERDGKILLAQRPAHADQAGFGSLPAAKS